MNEKEKRHLAIAYEAIKGQISWDIAGRRMKVTRVHTRICALLRKEYQDKIKHEV